MLAFKISVVVTTYNNEKTIQKCLESLVNQKLPPDQYEIIVVDGNSTDKTCKIVESFSKNSKVSIKLLQQKGKGISAARNTGIKAATGDWIILIDADAYASEDWLIEYLRCFNNAEERVGYIWGPTFPSNFENIISRALYGLGYSRLAHGANIAYNKKALEDVGFFDEEFIGRGDEVVVNVKMENKGYKSKKCERALVYHEFPTSVVKFLKLQYWGGYWRHRLQQKYFTSEQRKFYYFKLILMLLFLGLFLSIPYYLLLSGILGVLFLILFFGALSSIFLAYLKFVLKIDPKVDLKSFIIGIPIILLGQVFRLFGEVKGLLKLYNRDKRSVKS